MHRVWQKTLTTEQIGLKESITKQNLDQTSSAIREPFKASRLARCKTVKVT